MTTLKLQLLGTSEQGFHTILTSSQFETSSGFLPPLPPNLKSSFHDWQRSYRKLSEVRQVADWRIEFEDEPVTHFSIEEISYKREIVQANLNQWLDGAGDRWLPVRDRLVSIASQFKPTDKAIRILLDFDELKLGGLPWQEWALFEERYTNAEVALRVKGRMGDNILPPKRGQKVRILLVVGRSNNINTQSDLEAIKALEKNGAEVVSLIQPSEEELSKHLWHPQGYHLFIFTGHSSSQEDGSIGWIAINDRESLSIKTFKHAFKTAIDNGLQLAIFNSCDGLGLANQLAKLNLPRSIVMREPVPDAVAVAFLKHFFAELTHNQSLFSSVHTARKKLEPFNSQYPGAMWLPTICIRESALAEPLTWEKLYDPTPDLPPIILPDPPAVNWVKVIASLGGVTVLGLLLWLAFKPKTVVLTNLESCPQKPIQTPHSNPKNSNASLKCLADVSNVPKGIWQHGGSTTWAPIRDKVNPKIEQIFPDFNLTYMQHPHLPPGSGTGIQMLLEGQLSLAESSRPISDKELQKAKSRGFQLKQVTVAIDAIAIAVHPNLDLDGLTLLQLKDIYQGKITNWNQVGGPNGLITPYSRPDNSGTTLFFQEYILGGKAFGKTVVSIPTTTLALREVSQDEGGIYFATASELVPQCGIQPLPIRRNEASSFVTPYQGDRVLPEDCPEKRNQLNLEAFQSNQYPITRKLFAIVKQDASMDDRAGEAYTDLLLTDEGQQLIQEAGFIPIRSF